MRDPNRIDEFMDELKKLWKKCPDWRFGQLVVNALGVDPFYIEDDISLARITNIRLGIKDIDQAGSITVSDRTKVSSFSAPIPIVKGE